MRRVVRSPRPPRSFERSVPLPSGSFEHVAEAVLAWRVHREAGLRVTPPTAVAPGGEHVVRLGPVRAPVAVVEVVDSPDRRGFAYVTRPGHPEDGAERFVVERTADGGVRFTVAATSRPAAWWLRVLGPAADVAQDVMTRRYLRAARRLAGPGRAT